MPKLVIEKFQPPFFDKHPFDIQLINSFLGKPVQYASRGRYALYHILKSLNIKGKILIPAYICHTILWPLHELNIDPIFYDVDIRDLNANVNSIENLLRKYKVNAVLVASMYGNPADLTKLEMLCSKYKVYLIDDAAQSFGSFVDNRPVGSFGHAGFFSLSPGKPTAGHMGAFFWTSNFNYKILQTSHDWLHYMTYLDFYFNRLHIYETSSYKIFKILDIINKKIQDYFNLCNDDIAHFEKPIVAGIINGCLSGKSDFRHSYLDQFCRDFDNKLEFRILKGVRGKPNNHKLILILHDHELAQKFKVYLAHHRIFFLNGYPLLSQQLDSLPNCREINGRVFELPIEDNEDRMIYLYNVLRNFRG